MFNECTVPVWMYLLLAMGVVALFSVLMTGMKKGYFLARHKPTVTWEERKLRTIDWPVVVCAGISVVLCVALIFVLAVR